MFAFYFLRNFHVYLIFLSKQSSRKIKKNVFCDSALCWFISKPMQYLPKIILNPLGINAGLRRCSRQIYTENSSLPRHKFHQVLPSLKKKNMNSFDKKKLRMTTQCQNHFDLRKHQNLLRETYKHF